jgi:hypothetical protein
MSVSQVEGTESGAWVPKENGDRIEGRVVDVTSTDAGWGPYPIVTLRTAQGIERDVHAYHTVLRKELARRHPKIGDEITIVFQGVSEPTVDAKGNKRSGAKLYKVRGGRGAGYDWNADLSPEDRERFGGTTTTQPDVVIDDADLPAPIADDDIPF